MSVTLAERLRGFPLFALAPSALLGDWLRASQHVGYAMGETLFQEGSAGDWMYLLLKGRVRVLRRHEGKEATQAVLHAGQIFGDYALVKPGRNTATCRATSDVEVVQIPLAGPRRWLQETPALASFPKNWLQLHQLCVHLRGHANHGFMSAKSALAMQPHLISLAAGPMRTLQAEGLCENWWLFIQEGEVRIVYEDGVERLLGPGDSLGEHVLAGGKPPVAVCLSATKCLGLDREHFARPAQAALKPGEQSYAAKTLSEPSRVRWVGQREATDCGAAALAMIAYYHALEVTLENIRARVTIGPRGLSALELLEVARRFGMEGNAVRVSPQQMLHAQVPAILHFHEGHYVVLFRLTDSGAYLGDPASGLVTVSLAHLAERCTGTLLLLRPAATIGLRRHAP